MSAWVSVHRPRHCQTIGFVVSVREYAVATREKGGTVIQKICGTANGNRTRILALKGLRANRCTIAASSENDSNNYKGNRQNSLCGWKFQKSARAECYGVACPWPAVFGVNFRITNSCRMLVAAASPMPISAFSKVSATLLRSLAG